MKTEINVAGASSPSRNSSPHRKMKPRSVSTERLNSPAVITCHCDLQVPMSPTRAVKRLILSLSKNTLKLASNLSPRRRSSPAALSFHSPPPKSFFESRDGMVEELREVFRYLDADGDGKISWVELHSALASVGEEADEEEMQEMIKQFCDADGFIDVDGFIRLNCEEKGEEETEKELEAAFRMFQGTSPAITPKALQRTMSRLGVENSLSIGHCTSIISKVDLDGDGVVDLHEFKRMMTNGVPSFQ